MENVLRSVVKVRITEGLSVMMEIQRIMMDAHRNAKWNLGIYAMVGLLAAQTFVNGSVTISSQSR